MAKSCQSVESLIKSTFALQVAVRCTEEVEIACRKNHLQFCEMLRPFCALSNNGESLGFIYWCSNQAMLIKGRVNSITEMWSSCMYVGGEIQSLYPYVPLPEMRPSPPALFTLLTG